MTLSTYVSNMRLLTGVILLVFTAAAWGQPSGEVESIGFNNLYRPGGWTPMVVRIRPNAAPSGTYQIQVKQRDLDNDIAVFTRNITLTGSTEGGSRDQRFWMYFIAQPTNKGLPSLREGATLKEIQELIEVYLCEESGKQITQLPITSVPETLDINPGGFGGRRGCRLVLVVNDGNSRITWDEYRSGFEQPDSLRGVLEDVIFQPLRVRELPESALAYDAVDAVLWLDSDPAQLKADGGQREQALETWIRGGGHLVVGQGRNWQQNLAFGDWLPVDLEGTTTRDDPDPLRTLAYSTRGRWTRTPPELPSWDALKGPFSIAVASPREGAIVDQWTTLPNDKTRRPFIARRLMGCGAVSWMAQDPGDPTFSGATKRGWLNVWDHVFDWRNDSFAGAQISDEVKTTYQQANGVDFGIGLAKNLEEKGTIGLYITLAVVFFVLYWLAAGPGVFLYLVGKRRTHLSWFGYAAIALVATLITVGMVKLLLRGPPKMKHLSIVRGERGDVGQVLSRFGLYIPRDGDQEIELAKAPTAAGVSAISALPVHPAHGDRNVDTAGKISYVVPVRDASSDTPAAVTVPYRSSSKQFESRWTGNLEGKIEGSATVGRGFADIEGRLTNGTNRDLKDVYIAYKAVRDSRSEDWMFYLPEWKAGITIDLQQETRRGVDGAITPLVGTEGNLPGRGKVLLGQISSDWADFWMTDLRGLAQLSDTPWEDQGRIPRMIPILSFFDRLPPARVPPDNSRSRVELLRRGGRMLNLSSALAAGGLVVIGETNDAPLPVGLKVDGDDVEGTGRIVYQFVLPTKRKALEEDESVEATTRPN